MKAILLVLNLPVCFCIGFFPAFFLHGWGVIIPVVLTAYLAWTTFLVLTLRPKR